MRIAPLAAIGTALAASACCIGPLLLAVAGIGGAGALVALEPWRPLFAALTAALLGLAWWRELRRPATAECDCPRPRARRAGRGLLVLATAVAALALAVPWLLPVLVA